MATVYLYFKKRTHLRGRWRPTDHNLTSRVDWKLKDNIPVHEINVWWQRLSLNADYTSVKGDLQH